MIYDVTAFSIGITPDRLLFDGTEKNFKIINPNDAEIKFDISSKSIDCEPKQGEVAQRSEMKIFCNAIDMTNSNAVIVVETRLDDDEDMIGILPAVAIKAEIKGKNSSENRQDAEDAQKITGLSINEEEYIEQNGGRTTKIQIACIAALIIAIISVMVYSEIKKKKEEKQKEDLSELPSLPPEL